MSTNGTPAERHGRTRTITLITVTHLCLEHVWRLDQYAQDAEREGDDDLASLFRRMQEYSRKGAEESKKPLVARLSGEE